MLDVKKVLTEAELGKVDGDVLAKLEAAYRADLSKSLEDEAAKSKAKFESLVELVGNKVDEKVSAAVEASVEKMKTDAINGKLFEALQKITAIVEDIGIPATEVTKRLKQELAQADQNLQQAYAEREDIKKKLNYQGKLNRIYELTKGCSPDIVNMVIEHFKNEDIRAIDKNSIADFIDNNDAGDTGIMDIDVDLGGGLNMDKVEAALDEIQDNVDMDMPGFLALDEQPEKKSPVKRKALGEAASSKFRPERVRIPATGSAMVEQVQQPSEPVEGDVADAMKQMEMFQEMGFGRFA